MKWIHILSVALIGSVGCGPMRPGVPNDDVTVAEIQRAHRAWIDAAIHRDVTSFGSYMADGYVALISNGRTLDKPAWVAAISSGASRFESVELRDVRIRLHGETAVLTAGYTQVATSNGSQNNTSGVEMDTWVRHGGRWLVVSSAWSGIPTAPSQ